MEYQFKTFQHVIGRDELGTWVADMYSHYDAKDEYGAGKHVCIGANYDVCLPYTGHEYLVGTKDEPYEYKVGDSVEVADFMLSGVNWREATLEEFQPSTGYFVISFADTGVKRTVPLSHIRPVKECR